MNVRDAPQRDSRRCRAPSTMFEAPRAQRHAPRQRRGRKARPPYSTTALDISRRAPVAAASGARAAGPLVLRDPHARILGTTRRGPSAPPRRSDGIPPASPGRAITFARRQLASRRRSGARARTARPSHRRRWGSRRALRSATCRRPESRRRHAPVAASLTRGIARAFAFAGFTRADRTHGTSFDTLIQRAEDARRGAELVMKSSRRLRDPEMGLEKASRRRTRNGERAGL
jgi:hypothetical protein